MNNVKKAAMRRQVIKLFKSNPEGSTIEFLVNNEVYSNYKIPQNHFVPRDSKMPEDWVNGCFFCLDMEDIKRPKVELRVKR